MLVSFLLRVRNAVPLVALMTVFNAGCALIEIERDGVVTERRMSFFVPVEAHPTSTDGVWVSRSRALGLSQQGASTTLGYLAATYVQVVDPSQCSLLILVDQDSGFFTDLIAQLSTIAKGGCVVSMQPKEKT
jgi:hypothetical protein